MPHYHHVPGRLRIRIPAVKRNPVLASAVEREIRQLAGVRKTEANTLTGSIVIFYHPTATNASTLMSAVNSRGYRLDESKPETVRVPPKKSVPTATERLATKAAEKVVWYVIESAIERSVPALVMALL